MAPSSLIGALEELAKKRREFTSAIVTLASVAGVDAAPYLDGLAYVRVDMTQPGGALATKSEPPFGATAKEPPPRPQRPASPSTNGTRASDKVDGSKASAILAALKKRGEPTKPGDLAADLGLSLPTLRYQLQPLLKGRQVKAIGKTSGRRLELA